MPALLRPFFACLVVIACVLCVTAPPPAFAEQRSRDAFVNDTNEARSNHDRHTYRVCDDLTGLAQRWAQWMAQHHTMKHNPYLEGEMQNWQAMGENVGAGGSEPPIQRAFMGDTYHRDNILSRTFTQVGIGTARDNEGRLYVDEVFRRPAQ